MRSMLDSLLNLANKISKNRFTDNMRSMINLLLHLVNKILEINKKAKSKFTDNMRSMIDSLLQHVNKIMISESDKKMLTCSKSMEDI